MRTAILKDYYRLITRSLRRFFAILLITLIGVAFYVGIRSSSPDMRITLNTYFEDCNAHDVKLLSTLGFDSGDIEAIEKIDKVKTVEAGHFSDVFVTHKSGTQLVKAISLDIDKLNDESLDILSRPVLLKGSFPKAENECVIDERLAESEKTFGVMKIGDILTIQKEVNDSDNSESKKDEFTIYEYKIVGIVRNIEYIDFERGITQKGKGTLDGYFMIPKENFTSEVFTSVYIDVETENTNLFSAEYKEEIDEFCEKVEKAAKIRNPIRFADIIAEAEEKYEEGRLELNDAIDEFNNAKKELDDAKEELKKAATEIQNAKNEIDNAQIEINNGWAEINKARQEIIDSDTELKAAKEDLSKQKKEYETEISSAENQLANTKERLDGSKKELDQKATELKNRFDALEKARADLEAAKPFLKQEVYEQMSAVLELQKAELDVAEILLNAGKQEYTAGLALYEDAYAEFEKTRDSSKAKLDEAENEISVGEAKLQSGKEELSTNELKLIDAQNELDSAKAEISKNEKKLVEATKEYEEGQAKFDKEAPEAEEKIAEGKLELSKAEKDIDDLKEATWYTIDWRKNPGFEGYRQNCDRVNAIGFVFPIIFFLVAALVTLTTMTRLVEENRTNIGLYKALGYGRLSIVFKYLIYAGLAAALGIFFGTLIGSTLFPSTIYNAYRIIYDTPDSMTPLNWDIIIIAAGVAFASTVVPAFLVCQKELFGRPATLMRPKTPKLGKKILLERIPLIWNRLHFTHKVTFRNVFRYKKRLLMTILGIAGCTALLVTGFGLKNSVSDIVPNQFEKVQHYDISASINIDKAKKSDDDIIDFVENHSNISDYLSLAQYNVDIFANGKTKSAILRVPENPEALKSFIGLQERQSGNEIPLTDNCAVLTEKLMKLLEVSEGDTVVLYDSEYKKYRVTVGKPAENYFMDFIYMSPNLYKQIFRQIPAENLLLARLNDISTDAEAKTSEDFLKLDSVTELSFNTRIINQFDDMIKALDMVVLILIGSAAFLAAIVLFSLINVNLDERRQEIATLKVLGFRTGESCMYLYRENIILTLIGIAAGLFLGLFLCLYVIETAEIDNAMFGRIIHWDTYVISAAITAFFAFLINLFTIHLIHKISMVESMKSVE